MERFKLVYLCFSRLYISSWGAVQRRQRAQRRVCQEWNIVEPWKARADDWLATYQLVSARLGSVRTLLLFAESVREALGLILGLYSATQGQARRRNGGVVRGLWGSRGAVAAAAEKKVRNARGRAACVGPASDRAAPTPRPECSRPPSDTPCPSSCPLTRLNRGRSLAETGGFGTRPFGTGAWVRPVKSIKAPCACDCATNAKEYGHLVFVPSSPLPGFGESPVGTSYVPV